MLHDIACCSIVPVCTLPVKKMNLLYKKLTWLSWNTPTVLFMLEGQKCALNSIQCFSSLQKYKINQILQVIFRLPMKIWFRKLILIIRHVIQFVFLCFGLSKSNSWSDKLIFDRNRKHVSYFFLRRYSIFQGKGE